MNSNHVEYLVVGGYAVCFHGYYRTTADLDLWVAVNRQNASQLVKALTDFGFPAGDISEELFLERGRMVRMGVEPLRIEILTEISGCDFSECFANKIEAELSGVPTWLISLSDLIKNKLASGRLKDLNDAQELG